MEGIHLLVKKRIQETLHSYICVANAFVWFNVMPKEIEISECRTEDVGDPIKELWLGLAHEMFEIEHFTIPSEANANRWVEFVREGLVSGRNFLSVAKSGREPVGYAFASVSRDFPLEVAEFVGSINDVYVLPEFRGKGIGKRLVIKCIEKMKAKGVTAARLAVLTENTTAVKLYEKLGFRIYRYGMLK